MSEAIVWTKASSDMTPRSLLPRARTATAPASFSFNIYLAPNLRFGVALFTLAHELSHVLGLDHVQDPTELMHPVSSARADLGPGDRQGLALVGQAACE